MYCVVPLQEIPTRNISAGSGKAMSYRSNDSCVIIHSPSGKRHVAGEALEGLHIGVWDRTGQRVFSSKANARRAMENSKDVDTIIKAIDEGPKVSKLSAKKKWTYE